MSERIVTLDVREDIRQGREPFAKIMRTVDHLKEDQALRLIAPFQPLPLFSVLAREGFSHRAKPTPSGDWEVLFERIQTGAAGKSKRAHASASPKPAPRTACGSALTRTVDARGLEPPQPLVAILEALADLPEGAELHAHTDRRPMHLYAKLKERGFHGESQEQPDGSFVTRIRRAS